MISKAIVHPILGFCVWNLIIALLGLQIAAYVVLVISLFALLSMLSEQVRKDLYVKNRRFRLLDQIANLALLVWVLSWTYTFPIVFWGYLTTCIVFNLFLFTNGGSTDEA